MDLRHPRMAGLVVAGVCGAALVLVACAAPPGESDANGSAAATEPTAPLWSRSFEGADDLPSDAGLTQLAPGTVGIDSSTAGAGSASLRLDCPGPGELCLVDLEPVRLEGALSEAVRISARVRSEHPPSEGRACFGWVVWGTDPTTRGSAHNCWPGVTGRTGWATHTFDAAVPLNSDSVAIRLINEGAGTAWFDQIAVTPIEDPASARVGSADVWLLTWDGAPSRALTTWAGADEEPEFSPDGERLVFDSDREGSNDLYVLHLASGEVTRVTSDAAKEDHGAWSPDGEWLAFQYDAGDNTDVWLVRPDGSDRRRLTTHPARDGWPDWSPDGEWIVFSSDRTGQREVYLMRPDGTEQRQLTSATGGSTDPAWSPDGERIAFNSDRDGNSEIYVMRADGSGQTRLTTTPDTWEERPAWSPDGAHLLFTQGGSGWRGIVRLDVATGRMERVAGGETSYLRPNVSPSGEWIAAERR